MAPITILIPTYNRARALQAVWPSYVGDPLVDRIVLVNDGSSDGTSEVVKELAGSSPTPVELIEHRRRRGQQASRLTAIDAAMTDWALFGEDDVWLRQDYCSTLLRQAEDLGASAIAGRLLTARVPGEFSPDLLEDHGRAASEADIFDFSRLEADFSLKPARPIPAPYLHTIALIRRSLFQRVSFDTWYAGNGWREETDFYLSVNEAGERVYFTPDTACHHLRGPICASGGQRIGRLAVEYYALANTWHLVRKHWPSLRSRHGFAGTPMSWMILYFARRQWNQLARLVRGDFRSSYVGMPCR